MDELYGFKLIEQGIYTRFKNFETKEEIFIDTDLKTFTHTILTLKEIKTISRTI